MIMDDSGIDSDNKPVPSTESMEEVEIRNGKPDNGIKPITSLRKTSDLQKKLEKQRQLARKSNTPVDSQPKKSTILSRNRLVIPESRGITDKSHLLINLPSDESEDEFEIPLSRATQKEIKQQLIKDGYNLDLVSEDEDLDLIPPRPIQERCVCCDTNISGCTIL